MIIFAALKISILHSSLSAISFFAISSFLSFWVLQLKFTIAICYYCMNYTQMYHRGDCEPYSFYQPLCLKWINTQNVRTMWKMDWLFLIKSYMVFHPRLKSSIIHMSHVKLITSRSKPARTSMRDLVSVCIKNLIAIARAIFVQTWWPFPAS